MPPSTFRYSAVLAAAALFSAMPAISSGAEYLGAQEVLKKVSQAASEKGNPDQSADELRRRLADFTKKTPSPSPGEAAREWLAIFDLWQKPVRNPSGYSRHPVPEFSDLLAVLPPPAAWAALKGAMAVRPLGAGNDRTRELVLRLLADTLTSDRTGFARNFAALEKSLPDDPGMRDYWRLLLDDLEQAFADSSDDPGLILKALDRRLARFASLDEPRDFAVPDLVSLFGEEKAAAFLAGALVTPNVKLEISEGDRTRGLARKIAMEKIAELQQPQWSLACSLDGADLYRAMEKRFAVQSSLQATGLFPANRPRHAATEDHTKQNAQEYYLLGLIIEGRDEEAAKAARNFSADDSFSLSHGALDALEQAGAAKALTAFLHRMLAQNPTLPFWDDYITFAAKTGETTAMLAFVRESIAAGKAKGATRVKLGRRLALALLAADELDAGIGELQKTLELKNGDLEERGEIALQMARLGLLLDRKPLFEEGLHQVREIAGAMEKKNDPEKFGDERRRLLKALAHLLAVSGNGPAAEKLLLESLIAGIRARNGQPSEYRRYRNDASRQPLTDLAALYHEAGRHADVVKLLDDSPDWSASDLAQIYAEPSPDFRDGRRRYPIGYLAAFAFSKTGEKEPAGPALDAVIARFGGFDAGYELLAEMEGAKAIPKLDALFAADRFEERPLIWKARLLMESGDLEKAESTARQAIAIDPSDGEEGPGDRMRAYAVLAEIREARGDKKEAEFFREVVKAIRLSEKADRFYEAGLLSRAVTMYQESLNHFADAYCIQSRMARRLFEMGRTGEAEAHYRRAYELMPDSFGRVESHCFGCEQAFEGARQQQIAEKVFSGLAIKQPDKPQVHYLLGYLRQEQGRYGEALASYREAVKLDPDYLNAWKQIADAAEHIHIPPAERNAVALAILRLDPQARHSSHSGLGRVTDLAALWNAVAEAQAVIPGEPDHLYVLKASREQQTKDAAGHPDLNRPFSFEAREKFTPAVAIANQAVISRLSRLMNR